MRRLTVCTIFLLFPSALHALPSPQHDSPWNLSNLASWPSTILDVAKSRKAMRLADTKRVKRRRYAPRGARFDVPFRSGEQLNYKMRWMGIPVGTATFRVSKTMSFRGKPAWHFEMKARTNKYADAIYKVRDHMHSWVQPDMKRALHHTKKQREGSYRRDVTLRFDWKRNHAVYKNQWRAFRPRPIFADTFDPLGLLYGFRCQRFDRPGKVWMSATDGLKTVRAQVRVIGLEKVEVGDHKVDAWHVVPELKDVGGIFERSPGARMDVWFSADERRIPVKLKSKVIVGSFTATLVEARGLKS